MNPARERLLNAMGEPFDEGDFWWRLRREAEDAAFALAKPVRSPDRGPCSWGYRWPGRLYAHCPLCGSGIAGGWYEERDRGWTYPEGLRLHLEGRGSATPCRAMEAKAEELRPKARAMARRAAALASRRRRRAAGKPA